MKSAVAALALLLPALVLAQGTVEALALSISPAYPRPGSDVFVSPQSTVIDLGNSTMKVLVSGKQIYSGNTKTLPVRLLPPGQTTTISVSVTSRGQTVSKTISLKPADVSLVIEPVSSVPVLYPGKSLPPLSGSARIVAVADMRTSSTNRLDPSTLSYTWSVDGTTAVNASGIGRDSFLISTPFQYRTQTISVIVQSRDGTMVGSDTVTLASKSPVVRIYENHPLQGILFERALGDSHTISGAEISLVAVPFSFSTRGGLPEIQWFLNGTPSEGGSDITLRPQGTGQGRASLTATASKGSDESVSTSITLQFGEVRRGIFGL